MKNSKMKKVAVAGAMILTAGLLTFSPLNTEAASKTKLNKTKVTIKVGKTKKLKVKNTKKKVTWKSSNKKVVTVKKTGKTTAKLVAKKAGKATITAKVGKKTFKCKVTVKKSGSTSSSTSSQAKAIKKIKDYTLAKFTESTIRVGVGKTCDLFDYVHFLPTAEGLLTNSIRTKIFKWTSSDSSVLSINKYGVATAKKEGTSKVKFKIKREDGTWDTSSAVKVKVDSSYNVSFSVTEGLNMDWVNADSKLSEKYEEYGDVNSYFNYITVTVKNDSDGKITMDSSVDFEYAGGARGTNAKISYGSLKDGYDYYEEESVNRFYTESRQKIVIPAHSTVEVVYKNENLLCHNWSIGWTRYDLAYNGSGGKVYIEYNPYDNTFKDVT